MLALLALCVRSPSSLPHSCRPCNPNVCVCVGMCAQNPLCPGQYIDGPVREALKTNYGDHIARMIAK